MQSNGQIPTRIPNDGTTITVDMKNFVAPENIARFGADCSSINPEFTFLQIVNVTNDYCESFDSYYYCHDCPIRDLILIPDDFDFYPAEVRYVKLDKATNELVFRAEEYSDDFRGVMTVRLYISPFETVPGRQLVHVDITFLVMDYYDYHYYDEYGDYHDFYDYYYDYYWCDAMEIPEALSNVFIGDDGTLIYAGQAPTDSKDEVVPDEENEAEEYHDESGDIYEEDIYDYWWLYEDPEDHNESEEIDTEETEHQDEAEVDKNDSDEYDSSLFGSVTIEIAQQLSDFV